jgi:uncharacterized protein YceK
MAHMSIIDIRALLAMSLSIVLLAGCGSTTEIRPSPTYVGEYASARLKDIYLAVPGGKRLTFLEVFKGFEPQTGAFTTSLPFPKVAVSDVVYEAAKPVAAYYDAQANDNGYLEGPELVVLYIRESAIGLGHSVDYLGVNPRFNALATSAADIGGLMEFVKRNKAGMTENAQKIFRDIQQLGVDWRNRGKGRRPSGR